MQGTLPWFEIGGWQIRNSIDIAPGESRAECISLTFTSSIDGTSLLAFQSHPPSLNTKELLPVVSYN